MSLLELLFEDGGAFSPEPSPQELKQRLKSQAQEQSKLRVDAVVAIKKLAQENDRLRLYCAALARVLVKKGLVSVSELSEMIDTIDPEDGFRDGKLAGRPLPGEKPTPKAPQPLAKPPRKPAP